MKRWWLLGIFLLLLAAAIQFPAAWIAPEVARLTAQRWRLAGVEGTVWRGRGTLYALHRASGHWYAGPTLTWRVMWGELAKGVLAAHIESNDGSRMQAVGRWQGWSLERLEAVLPAVHLAALLPPTLSDYGWSGAIQARTARFGCEWERPDCTGQIEIVWTGAATAQIPGPALGDYRLRLIAEGDALRFDLGTARGRLQLAGSGEFSAGKLRFKGEAAAVGDNDVRLENILRTIGRQGPTPGRYLIEYQELQQDAG
jgi:general secretion pathway protein N